MTFVRNVVQDLVEKRLWPVALGLVVLIAAIPVLLGGGEAAPVPPVKSPSSSATSPATTTASVLTPGDTTPLRRERGGKLRDPFAWPKAKAPATTTSTASAPAPATSGGAPSSGFSSGNASPGSGSVGSGHADPHPTPTPAPKRPSQDVYRIDLRFGNLEDKKPTRIDDVARLTPLPSARKPFFVFLGVLKGGKRAGSSSPRMSRRRAPAAAARAGATARQSSWRQAIRGCSPW